MNNLLLQPIYYILQYVVFKVNLFNQVLIPENPICGMLWNYVYLCFLCFYCTI